MSYKTEFGSAFDVGFQLNNYPKLIDKSWHNDVCPSFYFKVSDDYFVLWVDYKEHHRRELDSARYTVVSAENLDCDESPDIVCGQDGEVVFSTENPESLSAYLDSVMK